MPITPLDAADDVFSRARIVLNHAKTRNNQLKAELVRSAMVIGVTALDAYLHRIVLQRLSSERANLSQRLKSLAVPFESMVEMSRRQIENQQAGKTGRPWTVARDAVATRLRQDSFQSPSGVESAYTLAGDKGPWKQAAISMALTPSEIRERVGKIANRRNQIVHEGDYPRLVRYHNLRKNEITVDAVEADLDFLQAFIAALNAKLG